MSAALRWSISKCASRTFGEIVPKTTISHQRTYVIGRREEGCNGGQGTDPRISADEFSSAYRCIREWSSRQDPSSIQDPFNFASRYSTSAASNDTFKLTVIKSSEMLRLINPLYALQTIRSYYHASSRFDVFPITSDNEDGRTSNEEIQTVFDTTFTCDWTQLSHKESRIEISLQ